MCPDVWAGQDGGVWGWGVAGMYGVTLDRVDRAGGPQLQGSLLCRGGVGRVLWAESWVRLVHSSSQRAASPAAIQGHEHLPSRDRGGERGLP